eukprot:jgi/Mesvir1/16367/Mv18115-RA.1
MDMCSCASGFLFAIVQAAACSEGRSPLASHRAAMQSHRVAWDDSGPPPASSASTPLAPPPVSPPRRRTVDGCGHKGDPTVECNAELMAEEMLRRTAEQAALLSPFRRILRVLDIRILTKTTIQLEEAEEIRALLYDCALGQLDLHKPVFLYRGGEGADEDASDAWASGCASTSDVYGFEYGAGGGRYGAGPGGYGAEAGVLGSELGSGNNGSPILGARGRPPLMVSSAARLELLADEEMQRWLRSM